MRLTLLLCVLVVAAAAMPGDLPPARDASHHNLAAPFPDTVPDWSMNLGAKSEGQYIRLTPAKQSRMGYLWNTVPVEMSDWEVTFEFQVTGQPGLGGDGFAFWYVDRPELVGPVYGGMDFWNGLGIFFDTYNNDKSGENPLISGTLNDGRIKYDHGTDGASHADGTCSLKFRNHVAPSVMKVRYQGNSVTVESALDRDRPFTKCFQFDEVFMAPDGYFGFTAATGDVADNHDVVSFSVKDLSPPDFNVEAVRAEARAHHEAEVDADVKMSLQEFEAKVIASFNQLQSSVSQVEQTQQQLMALIESPRFSRSIPLPPLVNRDGQPMQPGGDRGDRGADNAELTQALQRFTSQMSALQAENERVRNSLGTLANTVSESCSGRTGGGNEPPRQVGNMPNYEGQFRELQGTTERHGNGIKSAVDLVANDVKANRNDISTLIATVQNQHSEVLRRLASGEGAGAAAAEGGWMGTIITFVVGLAGGFGVNFVMSRRGRNQFKLP